MSANEIALLRKDFLTLVSRVEVLEFKLARLATPKASGDEKKVDEKSGGGGYESDTEEDEHPSLLLKMKKKINKGDKKS
jgi:hypothetical protein